MRLAVFGPVRATDVLGLGAPDCGVAVGRSHDVFLMVGGPEYTVACEAEEGQEGSLPVGQVNGIAGKILGLDGVDGGDQGHGAPAQVVAEMVMADVDGAKIPVGAS